MQQRTETLREQNGKLKPAFRKSSWVWWLVIGPDSQQECKVAYREFQVSPDLWNPASKQAKPTNQPTKTQTKNKKQKKEKNPNKNKNKKWKKLHLLTWLRFGIEMYICYYYFLNVCSSLPGTILEKAVACVPWNQADFTRHQCTAR